MKKFVTGLVLAIMMVIPFSVADQPAGVAKHTITPFSIEKPMLAKHTITPYSFEQDEILAKHTITPFSIGDTGWRIWV